MSPVYLNPQQSSSIPFLEFKGDHQQHSLPLLGYVQHDRVNNPYFSRSGFENHHASSDFLAMDYSRLAQDKVVEKLILSQDKPSDRTQAIPSSTQLHHYAADGSGSSYVYPFDQGDHHKIEIIKTDQQPKKCKPTKLRIMQRTSTGTASLKPSKITRDHKVHHGLLAQTNNNGLRMCTDCHTTTTPLWRSGPQGPKSLCNACGIRQRKARRAAMAAAAAAAEYAKDNGATTVTSSSSMSSTTTTVEAPKLEVEDMKPEMKFDRSHTLPLKKRSKTLNASWSFNNNNNNNNNSYANNNNNNNNNNSHNGGEKLSLEDFGWNSSKNYIKGANSSQRVFPQDEEEGAILLMALSCGMACSS